MNVQYTQMNVKERVDYHGYRIIHLDKDMHSILREKRNELGLTQHQVADKAKIKLQQYQKFESGERNIRTVSFRIACSVIESLGMDISDFYHGEYIIGKKIEI